MITSYKNSQVFGSCKH